MLARPSFEFRTEPFSAMYAVLCELGGCMLRV